MLVVRGVAFPSLQFVQLHENEFEIDTELVQGLLATQVPDLAELSLRRLDSSGTVNAIYRLGDDLLVRLPRAPEYVGGPEREARWMPVFAQSLPIHVPKYEHLGRPTAHYPSHWSVLEWVEGDPAAESTVTSLDQAATDLGETVVALREVSTANAPTGGNYRAFGLAGVDVDFRDWLAELPDDIDRFQVESVWDACVSVDEWALRPSWVHTDLRGDNLIARGGRLVAVIDWEGCTVGDPSADHLAAWWLFDGDSRETFRTASGASKDTWFRAMGWALFMSVAAIPYYADTNPAFVGQAHRALDEIFNDYSDHA
jgi:aminoglycoside phosphotransferase (APT) family kinase protein